MDIATRPKSHGASVAFREPVLSYRLSSAIQQITNPHPDIGMPKQFPAIVQAEARDAIVELEPFCQPVTRHRFERWLQPIGAVVANAPAVGSDDYLAWLAGMLTHFQATAIGAFTQETSSACAKANDFWPTAKGINAIVAGPSMALRTRLDGLRRIAEANTEEAPKAASGGPVPVPEWVGDRGLRKASGPVEDGDKKHLPYHAPTRSVADQLAALGFPDGVSPGRPRGR